MATNRRDHRLCIDGSIADTRLRFRAPPPEELVAQAEANLRLTDDIHADETAVHEPGESAQISGTSVALDVTVGANDPASSGSVYTSDQLSVDSTRLAAVLSDDRQTAASWDFGADIVLVPTGDGRVSITDHDGNLLGGIEEPWAVDAAGNSLDTAYTIEGTTLVQDLATDDSTSYHVVADPTVRLYPGYYQVNFNKSESQSVVGSVNGCFAVLARATHPALKALQLACGALGGYGTARLAGGRCLRINVAGLPPAAWTWWPSYPRC